MAITSDIETRGATETVVSIRIPNGAGEDLETEAERRLSRVAGVRDATIEEMQGLEPGLSATVVTVNVTVQTTEDVGSEAPTELFADAVGIDLAEDHSV